MQKKRKRERERGDTIVYYRCSALVGNVHLLPPMICALVLHKERDSEVEREIVRERERERERKRGNIEREFGSLTFSVYL